MTFGTAGRGRQRRSAVFNVSFILLVLLCTKFAIFHSMRNLFFQWDESL